jgi:hypothetical protein
VAARRSRSVRLLLSAGVGQEPTAGLYQWLYAAAKQCWSVLAPGLVGLLEAPVVCRAYGPPVYRSLRPPVWLVPRAPRRRLLSG